MDGAVTLRMGHLLDRQKVNKLSSLINKKFDFYFVKDIIKNATLEMEKIVTAVTFFKGNEVK